jgi:hypothetical protein
MSITAQLMVSIVIKNKKETFFSITLSIIVTGMIVREVIKKTYGMFDGPYEDINNASHAFNPRHPPNALKK